MDPIPEHVFYEDPVHWSPASVLAEFQDIIWPLRGDGGWTSYSEAVAEREQRFLASAWLRSAPGTEEEEQLSRFQDIMYDAERGWTLATETTAYREQLRDAAAYLDLLQQYSVQGPGDFPVTHDEDRYEL